MKRYSDNDQLRLRDNSTVAPSSPMRQPPTIDDFYSPYEPGAPASKPAQPVLGAEEVLRYLQRHHRPADRFIHQY